MKIWPTAGWTLRCWPASAPASSSKPRRQRLCLYRRRADRQQILRRRRRHRVRKDDTALLNAFNAALQAIRANGTYKKINDKYFDFDMYGAEQ